MGAERLGAPVLERETRLVVPLLLFLVAVALRVGAAARTAVMFNDGPVFLDLAGLMSRGEWVRALSHDFHPLYSFVTLMFQLVVGDWERAAVCVSVVSGSAAVVAVYFFLRYAFDARTAWIGGLLLALMPYAVTFSADIQSEGLYLALFTAALACLWRALQVVRIRLAALAGVLAGLAYLTRPEGIGVVVVGAGMAGLALLRGRWSWRTGTSWLAALVVGAMVTSGPYLVFLRVENGVWTLTQKKSLSSLIGSADEKPLKRREPARKPEKSKSTGGAEGVPRDAGSGKHERDGAGTGPGAARSGSRFEGSAGSLCDPGRTRPGADSIPRAGLYSEAAFSPLAPALAVLRYRGGSAPCQRVVSTPGSRTSWAAQTPGLSRLAAAAGDSAGARRTRRSALSRIGLACVSALSPPVVLLLALGLYTCRGRPTGRALFAGAFLLLYGVVIYGLAQNVGYVTRRHVLPPLIPLLGYAAAGVPVLGAALLRAVPGRSLSPRLRARAAVWVSVLLVSGYCLPKALAWHRVGDLATRRAAEWLAGRPELGGPVASEKRRVAYYAGEKSVILDEGGDADGAKVDIATLYRRGARFLIIDEDQIESYPSLRRSLEAAPPALHRTEAGGRRAVVFELRAPKKGQGAGLR